MATDELPACPLCGGEWEISEQQGPGAQPSGVWIALHECATHMQKWHLLEIGDETRAAVVAAVRKLCETGEQNGTP